LQSNRTQWFTELRATLIAVALAVLLLVVTYTLQPDTFEHLSAQLHALEKYEADELVLCFAIVLVGISVDTLRMRRRKHEERDRERMQVFRATMSTVHDLVNNALNSMQLLRFEADDNKTLSPEALALFDSIVQTTAQQLTLLGSVEEIVLHKRAGGLDAIDYSTGSGKDVK
jgi:hypothetical protein